MNSLATAVVNTEDVFSVNTGYREHAGVNLRTETLPLRSARTSRHAAPATVSAS